MSTTLSEPQVRGLKAVKSGDPLDGRVAPALVRQELIREGKTKTKPWVLTPKGRRELAKVA